MNDWTLFYWGWWIAWCPFVGMFIAKISFGRTVKDFIFGVMAAPVIYVSLWFIMFGGAGLRMEREAANNGLCCRNSRSLEPGKSQGIRWWDMVFQTQPPCWTYVPRLKSGEGEGDVTGSK